MDATQFSSFSQWGNLDWDDEFEDLCVASSQSATGTTNDTECEGGDSPLAALATSDAAALPCASAITTNGIPYGQISQRSHEDDYNASEGDGETVTPSDAPALHWAPPYHPGWTFTLSPSLSPEHSTPPEVNNWAFSALIGESINREIEMRGDEIDRWNKDLRRHTVLCSALLHTDDFDFSGYAYPHGATGCKMVPQTKHGLVSSRQGSLLRLSGETLEYTDTDSRAIQANVSSQLADIWGAGSRNNFQDKMEEKTGTKPNNVVNEQEKDMNKENAEASLSAEAPHQRKESQTSTLIEAQQDDDGDEETLNLAKKTALPGIDLIDDFVEDSPVSSGDRLDILNQLTRALESANNHMMETLRQVTQTASWAEGVSDEASDYGSDLAENVGGTQQPGPLDLPDETVPALEWSDATAFEPAAEPAQQQRTDTPGPNDAQPKETAGMETRESEKEEQVPPSSLFATLSCLGGFLRECWRGNPRVLD